MNLYDIAIARKLSGGGGGGSSDFTTATVTFVVSAADYPDWIGACAEGANPVCMSDHAEGTIKGENGTKTVILYKGYTFIRPEWNAGLTISVSGNASKDIYDNVTITGDCTITIS